MRQSTSETSFPTTSLVDAVTAGTTIATSPIVNRMHTRGSPKGYVHMELPVVRRETKTSHMQSGANANKETFAPAATFSVTKRAGSASTSSDTAQQPQEPRTEQGPAVPNIADRIKSNRRSSAKMNFQSTSASVAEQVAALALLASSPAPRPPTATPDVQPQSTQPQSQPTLKRKASDTIVRKAKVKFPNGSTPKDQLSQSAVAIAMRARRADKNKLHCVPAADQAPSPTQPELDLSGLSRKHSSMLKQLVTPVPAEVTNDSTPTPLVPVLPAPVSAPKPSTTSSKITPTAYEDLVKYSKPGENLDWTKETDSKKRARMRSIISSRKHNEKRDNEKRAAKKGKAPTKLLTDDVNQLSGSNRIQPHQEANVSKPRQAQRSVVEPNPDDRLDPVTPETALDLADHEFIAHMVTALEDRILSGETGDFVEGQSRRILQLLDLAVPPKDGEALFLFGEEAGKEASKYLQPNAYFEGPIFTSDQQPLPTQSLAQFFSEHYDDSMSVHVQDPAIRVARNEPHVWAVKMGKVKERFAKGVSNKPWNLLELATHVEDGLRPAFLNTEDCRLLTKVKMPGDGDMASRKGYEKGWKEVEKWALVAQAGALTEPHQDSHGYSTYITLNQGMFGFGWLANPSEEERAAWYRSHNTFIDGKWRYAILRKGQTVYFPAGTVHFVFRLPAAGDTLAFGGHVLRCSQIVRWIKTLIEERRSPNITNEDLTTSAPGYLDKVERFVKQAMKTGQETKWGGKAAIEEFLQLKTEFEEMKRV